MKFSRLSNWLRYYAQFFPFRINFMLLMLIIFLGYRYLNGSKVETSSFSGLAFLMAKIIMIFSIVIIAVSFLSCFISWIYFLLGKNANQVDVTMDVTDIKRQLRIRTLMPNAIKPFLGFVKTRFFYNQYQMTDKMIIAGRVKKQFIPVGTGLSGNNLLLLPDIKEYHFEKSMIYFEDMLQLFSLVATTSINHSILNTPKSFLRSTNDLPPKKTEEEIVRIEQLRKVEGEHLNYKKFEDSDDVRRIVWKIFAKNKELVVRVPEVMDPFASHLYFYATYFNCADFILYNEYQQVMLNFYKNCVWTLFEALTQKEFEVKYISDQDVHFNESGLNPTQVKIALSTWHQDVSIADYFKPKSGSVLCIHSFTSPEELTNLLSNCDSNTTIFFVQMSKAFKSYYLLNWISRLFLKPPSDALQRMKSRWAIHPLKFNTINREKKLMNVLSKSNLNIELI